MVVVLVGFMGAGKTTVGHIIAERLGQPFVDSDVLIEQRLGRNIRDIFAPRARPTSASSSTPRSPISSAGEETVIALGGGAVEDRGPAPCCATPGSSTSGSTTARPCPGSKVTNTGRCCTGPISTSCTKGGCPSTRTCRRSPSTPTAAGRTRSPARCWRSSPGCPPLPPHSSSVFVTPAGATYYAHVGRGLTGRVDALLPALPEVERGLIIEANEDEGVAAAGRRGLRRRGHRRPSRRPARHPGVEDIRLGQYLADAFADHAMHRGDLVIAVGGEAIGDIAGFVAATFNRGMRLSLVPTTLAAQADSAVGGKNAINLGLGRTLVGTIHQPVVVISDTEVACANAERGFKSGLAQIVKHALISPSDLLGYLQGARGEIVSRDPDAVAAAATRSVEIKADIVSRGERERGDRLFLNYGHTFAHAIELVRDPPPTTRASRSRWA